jgi:hypothetical protein
MHLVELQAVVVGWILLTASYVATYIIVLITLVIYSHREVIALYYRPIAYCSAL